MPAAVTALWQPYRQISSGMSEFAGILRERITIERPTTSRHRRDLQESGWEPVARCLAAIELEGVGRAERRPGAERDAEASSDYPPQRRIRRSTSESAGASAR